MALSKCSTGPYAFEPKFVRFGTLGRRHLVFYCFRQPALTSVRTEGPGRQPRPQNGSVGGGSSDWRSTQSLGLGASANRSTVLQVSESPNAPSGCHAMFAKQSINGPKLYQPRSVRVWYAFMIKPLCDLLERGYSRITREPFRSAVYTAKAHSPRRRFAEMKTCPEYAY